VESHIYTVRDITVAVKTLIEQEWPDVVVEGEISNFKPHYSGHWYFSLKDEYAQISCTMWRGRNRSVKFRPEDGMQIQCRGALSLYEKQGRYQLDIQSMHPVGTGDLQQAFDRLKAKLLAEGLFDQSRKRPLPPYPTRIGIVTSPTGAAIRDMVSVIQRRFPAATLVLRPAQVQGAGAAEDIAAAIDECNEYGSLDVLIVGRGGGSLEDLWAFNEEVTARAIARSALPVVSAVGHEIDFTIADFVADVRAPTPSAAGELVVMEQADLEAALQDYLVRCHRALQRTIDQGRETIRRFEQSYGMRRPADMLKQFTQTLDDQTQRLIRAQQHVLQNRTQAVETLAGQLKALDPMAVLDRGYSICYKEPERQLVRDSRQLQPDDAVTIRLAAGSVQSRVENVVTETT
jgi:exodeoxyribonuclease VII large subunit